jgi:hypothetical protein
VALAWLASLECPRFSPLTRGHRRHLACCFNALNQTKVPLMASSFQILNRPARPLILLAIAGLSALGACEAPPEAETAEVRVRRVPAATDVVVNPIMACC